MYRINQTNMQLKDLAHLQNLRRSALNGTSSRVPRSPWSSGADRPSCGSVFRPNPDVAVQAFARFPMSPPATFKSAKAIISETCLSSGAGKCHQMSSCQEMFQPPHFAWKGRWPVQALLSGPGSGLEPKGPTLVFSPMPVLRIGCEQSVSGVG